MCRLVAITGNLMFRDIILHTALLASNADNQKDGWGISDGLVVHKSKREYHADAALPYIHSLNENNIWIGHVRQATLGMETSEKASHPFLFDINGKPLVAAHNGTIGIPVEEAKIKSDSFVVFSLLADYIKEHGMSPNTIQRWISHFEKEALRASYAFMLMYEGRLYVLRNKQRTLHKINIGDAVVIHTSASTLETTITNYLSLIKRTEKRLENKNTKENANESTKETANESANENTEEKVYRIEEIPSQKLLIWDFCNIEPEVHPLEMRDIPDITFTPDVWYKSSKASYGWGATYKQTQTRTKTTQTDWGTKAKKEANPDKHDTFVEASFQHGKVMYVFLGQVDYIKNFYKTVGVANDWLQWKKEDIEKVRGALEKVSGMFDPNVPLLQSGAE